MQHSTGYIVGFAAAVCLVASLFVAGSAVGLKDRQDQNRLLDVQKKVLTVAGLMDSDADLSDAEIGELYSATIQPKAIDLKTGQPAPDVDVQAYDQQKAMKDPASELRRARQPARRSTASRTRSLVFDVVEDGELKALILPIEGQGPLGDALRLPRPRARRAHDRGITFYEHDETPGLGGEVDNPRWKAQWPGRLAFDGRGNPKIGVKKGLAGSVEEDPYQVDGLSGATITSRGVTATSCDSGSATTASVPTSAKYRAERRFRGLEESQQETWPTSIRAKR